MNKNSVKYLQGINFPQLTLAENTEIKNWGCEAMTDLFLIRHQAMIELFLIHYQSEYKLLYTPYISVP